MLRVLASSATKSRYEGPKTAGLSNMSLTLGTGHPYGVDPVRAPNRMSAHVQSVASSNPACLAPVGGDQIFTDGFESGDTSAWSSTVP
jgi:hypothetical protein